LRQNGALDESNPINPRVIIPNYVNGLSNCVGISHFHSTCCVNECETLMDTVERSIGQPEASPEDIVSLVQTLPSATVLANRVLPDVMLTRLRAIANSHQSGMVPLHGRLFSQWMHHAYPRECPYPHLAGSTSPVDIYTAETEGIPYETTEDMQVLAAKQKRRGAPVEHARWIDQEELLVPTQAPLAFHHIHFATGAAAAMILVVGLSRTLLRGARTAAGIVETSGKRKKKPAPMLSEPAFAVV